MTPGVFVLVLVAAVLHATWNALLKSGGDRLRSITIMTAAAGVASAPALFFLPFPTPASWPDILLSTVLHLVYNLFLVRAYRYGDLGQVYPIARGASPLLVTLGAALVAGERPDGMMLVGIALVSAGIVSLAWGWKGASRAGVGVALTTGALIAAYTLTDGLGGRLSGNPQSYSAWLFVLDGMPLLILSRWRRDPSSAPFWRADRETAKAVAGGLVSLVAYTAVIWAASVSPMGAVSALRETSVVFAALIGRLFLSEALTRRRVLSCLAVALGALILGRHAV